MKSEKIGLDSLSNLFLNDHSVCQFLNYIYLNLKLHFNCHCAEAKNFIKQQLPISNFYIMKKNLLSNYLNIVNNNHSFER